MSREERPPEPECLDGVASVQCNAHAAMGLFSAGRGPRGFKYKPRFYDPDNDDKQELKRKMRARGRGRERQSSLSLVIMIGLLLLTLFLYQAL